MTRAGLGPAGAQVASMTSMSLRPLRRPKRTTPSAVANRVSSPPRPTLSPGWKRVPRWRTMMVPARTLVPAPTLTPRRCAAESRPLREEAAPFFFDMVDPCSAGGDLGDLDQREALAVTPAATLVGLRLVGEPADLLPAAFLDDAGHDPGGAELVGGGEDPVTVDEEHRGQLDLAARVAAEPLDLEPLAGLDPILLAACADHRVHRNLR